MIKAARIWCKKQQQKNTIFSTWLTKFHVYGFGKVFGIYVTLPHINRENINANMSVKLNKAHCLLFPLKNDPYERFFIFYQWDKIRKR